MLVIISRSGWVPDGRSLVIEGGEHESLELDSSHELGDGCMGEASGGVGQRHAHRLPEEADGLVGWERGGEGKAAFPEIGVAEAEVGGARVR